MFHRDHPSGFRVRKRPSTPTPRSTTVPALLCALAIAAGVSLPALPAFAEGAPESANALREKARASLASGDTAAACLLFEQSYQAAKAAPRAGIAGAAPEPAGPAPDDVLFELADCHARQGKDAIAVAEYEQVESGTGPHAEQARRRASKLKAPTEPAPSGEDVGGTGATGVEGGSAAESSTGPVAMPAKEEHPTRLGEFMDTRLAWTFGDDDVLHATGQALPLSPTISIGDRPQYRLFFDALNSRFTGRENLTHLALYKKMPGFIKKLDTEASLIIRFDIAALSTNSNNLNQALYDAGTYIRIFYHTSGGSTGKKGLGITFWPIDTDRFRLGYLYDISWGGTAASINQSIFPGIQGAAPGAKVQYDGSNWSVFAGFKTAQIAQISNVLTPGTSEIEQININQTNYGALAGASLDASEWVHLDVNGGFFQQGEFNLPDVLGQPAWTAGVSARLIAHHPGMPVPQSIDFLLYRNDPNKPQVIFKPETYVDGKTTWSASAEFTNLFQNLKDFEVAGATEVQQARAGAVQATVKSSFLRASLTGIYRDLPYVLRNQPSFIPFETIPKAATTTNELFVAGAVDYYVDSVRLTPGIGGGVQIPATFKSTTSDSASGPIDRTVVVRQQGNYAILPIGQGATPIIQARASLKWDLSRILSAMVWVQYERDNNATFVERDPVEGTVELRQFISPNFFGMGTSVQARF